MDKTSKGIYNKIKIYIIVILVLSMFVIGGIAIKTLVYPIKYKDEIKKYSSKYGLDPYLVMAVINTESRFNKDAVSHKDAKGLMQIMDSTAKEVNDITNSVDELDATSIYDIDVNIELGCSYLASLISRYNGNYYLAICAYNAGIGNVNTWIDAGIIPLNLDNAKSELPFKETQKYLNKVLHYYKTYKIIYYNI